MRSQILLWVRVSFFVGGLAMLSSCSENALEISPGAAVPYGRPSSQANAQAADTQMRSGGQAVQEPASPEGSPNVNALPGSTQGEKAKANDAADDKGISL